MAISIRKSKSDQLATVTPIHPTVDYPRLEATAKEAAQRIAERASELVPVNMPSPFGPVQRFGMLPDATATGRLRHSHGLPAFLVAVRAPLSHEEHEVTALPSRENAQPNMVKHLSEMAKLVDPIGEDKPAPVEKKGVEQVTAPAIDPSKTAAKIQRAMGHLGVIVWWGEHTQEYWVMDAAGLRSFADVTSLYEGMEWDN